MSTVTLLCGFPTVSERARDEVWRNEESYNKLVLSLCREYSLLIPYYVAILSERCVDDKFLNKDFLVRDIV